MSSAASFTVTAHDCLTEVAGNHASHGRRRFSSTDIIHPEQGRISHTHLYGTAL